MSGRGARRSGPRLGSLPYPPCSHPLPTSRALQPDAPAPPTHLLEAERHGEYADAHDAVHHVRDQPPLGGGGGGHLEGLGARTERPWITLNLDQGVHRQASRGQPPDPARLRSSLTAIVPASRLRLPRVKQKPGSAAGNASNTSAPLRCLRHPNFRLRSRLCQEVTGSRAG